MANYFGGGERYWEDLNYEVSYYSHASTSRSDQYPLACNFYYAALTYPPYPEYMQNVEPPQDTPYYWMDPSEEERILQSIDA